MPVAMPAKRKKDPSPWSDEGKDMADVKAQNTYESSMRPARKATTGSSNSYPTYSKKSEEAKAFRSAFAEARKSGASTFSWGGRKYTTKVKGE